MRALAPHVDRFTAVCDFLGNEIAHQWRVPTDRVTVIPSGVDLDRIDRAPSRGEARARLGIPDDVLVVGAVAGRFRAVKCLPNLVDAFGRIARTHGSLHLVLVGDPLELGEQLRARARLHQVEGRFHLPGHIPGALSVLRALDVMVNCSSFEGASNAIIEAMGAGLPVVATRVGGTPELIEHGVSGLLVPPNDVRRLADAIDRLVSDRDLRQTCGRGARRRIEQRHTHAAMIARYTDLYRDVGAKRFRRTVLRRITDLGTSVFRFAEDP